MGYQIDFTKYLRYHELTEHLKGLVAAYPELSSIESIGKSYEGRDLYVVTLTNKKTGEAGHKPGFYVEGNMHAGEVTGSMVSLYLIWYLLENYGKDREATELLDTRTVYVNPRVSPDGAELYLTTPYTVRSSVRPYPNTEPEDGLYPEDVDGDGHITWMRVKDPSGGWKVSEKDPRVMVKRSPEESGGTYYSLYTEGLIRNYNGKTFKAARAYQGLDFNRNYPANWSLETVQPGSGPYPLSEPETRAVAEFMLAHPNIVGAHSYHTFTGVILRPPCTTRDEKVPPKDIATYNAIARIGTETTGYPLITVMDLNSNRPSHGNFKDWCYEHLGIHVFTTELWDLAGVAGAKRHSVDFLRKKEEEDDIAVLKWLDENLCGDGFVNWRPFEHPQLGPVEIGGYKFKFTIQNPPPSMLPQECHKNAMFSLKHALLSPLVRVKACRAAKVRDDVFCVEAEIENQGYLPTNVTDMAKRVRIAKPVVAEILYPQGVKLLSGTRKIELGFLEGRSASSASLFGASPAESRRTVQWLVASDDAALVHEIRVLVESEKAGRDVKTVKIE